MAQLAKALAQAAIGRWMPLTSCTWLCIIGAWCSCGKLPLGIVCMRCNTNHTKHFWAQWPGCSEFGRTFDSGPSAGSENHSTSAGRCCELCATGVGMRSSEWQLADTGTSAHVGKTGVHLLRLSHLVCPGPSQLARAGALTVKKKKSAAGPAARAIARACVDGVSWLTGSNLLIFPKCLYTNPSEILNKFFCRLGHLGVLVGRKTDKASDKRACDLAYAFYMELRTMDAEEEAESQGFLKRLARLHETGHQNELDTVLEEFGIQAPIPISFIDVAGLGYRHPVLKPRDVLETMSKSNKLVDCFLHGHDEEDYLDFWGKFRAFEPDHQVFSTHSANLARCVPYNIHLDEGTGPKKKALLVLQMHAVIGLGSKRADGLNFLGSTFKTRLLYSTMPAKTHSKQKNEILESLLDCWARDLETLFTEGVEYTKPDGTTSRIYGVCLACKGDWPALKLAGNLTRHFGRLQMKESAKAAGICHLCMAGVAGIPWHEHGPNAKWLLDKKDSPLPWKCKAPPPLLLLYKNPSFPQSFFKIDIFHTLHKGCFADLAASATVSCPIHIPTTFLLYELL